MALIALLAAVSFTAVPNSLVLGKDAGANLEVRASGATHVAITANLGTVSRILLEGGVFRARYTPPALNAPAVALLLATIDGHELRWVSLPLAGSDILPLETRPRAKVEVQIGGKTFGPVTADRKGNASVPVVVPPGVREATLHITDRLGNRADKPLDLDPPPFTRLRAASREEVVTSSALTEVEIFVVQGDGSPDDHAQVIVTSDRGQVSATTRVEPGVYVARVIAPQGETTGTLALEAKASGQVARLSLPVRAHKALAAQPSWNTGLANQQPWARSLGLIVGQGATFSGAASGSLLVEFGLRLNTMPVEAFVQLGESLFASTAQGAGETAKAQLPVVNLGARAGVQVLPGLDLHVTLSFGIGEQYVQSTLPDGRVFHTDSAAPRAALAFGGNLALGPGRVLVQAQLDATPSGLARLTGSLGGGQLQAGYLLNLP